MTHNRHRLAEVHEAAQDLRDAGAIDALTMRRFDALCLSRPNAPWESGSGHADRFVALWNAGVPTREMARDLGISISTLWHVRTRLKVSERVSPGPDRRSHMTKRS